MAPYEALYEHHSISPIGWFEQIWILFIESELVQDALEKVTII